MLLVKPSVWARRCRAGYVPWGRAHGGREHRDWVTMGSSPTTGVQTCWRRVHARCQVHAGVPDVRWRPLAASLSRGHRILLLRAPPYVNDYEANTGAQERSVQPGGRGVPVRNAQNRHSFLL